MKMEKHVQEIGSGDAAIDKTVSEMWRLINRDTKAPEIKAQAKKLKAETNIETIKNTFNYVWKNFPYKSDPAGYEQLTAPVHMINGNNPREDCDGLVMLLITLLQANNIPARIKVIAWRKNDYTHVICEAKHGSYWMPLDPTRKTDGFGNQVRKVIREKRYSNPMEMITLEDNFVPGSSGSGGCGCKKKNRKDADNVNIINIGNSADEHVSTDMLNGNRLDTYAQGKTTLQKEYYPVEKEVPVPYALTKIKEKITPVGIPVSASLKPAKYWKEFY